MIFYIGTDRPHHAIYFERACMSINVLRRRQKPLPQGCSILLDSGAFSELERFGAYRHPPSEYAASVRRLVDARIVNVEIAVAQDFMCEPFMLARTGLHVDDHQRLTINRYDALMAECLPVPIMPVLQGYRPSEYLTHLAQYGPRLSPGMRVGVGSVCKRNGSPEHIIDVLDAIKSVRPDLRLHGFGVKKTSLAAPAVRSLLYSADSMAWSYAARREARDRHGWREALSYEEEIKDILSVGHRPWQPRLFVVE